MVGPFVLGVLTCRTGRWSGQLVGCEDELELEELDDVDVLGPQMKLDRLNWPVQLVGT